VEGPALTNSNSALGDAPPRESSSHEARPASSRPGSGRVARRTFQIAGIAVMALVVLRIGVGWRFLHEGLWKYRHASYTAADFLRQARGPLAEQFHRLIPDYYGLQRLDLKTMVDRWTAYRDALAAHYGFDNERHVWLFPPGTPPDKRRPGPATARTQFASHRDLSGITFYAREQATLQRVRGPLPSPAVAVAGVEVLQHDGAWYLFTDREQLAAFRKSIESQATSPAEPLAGASVSRTSSAEGTPPAPVAGWKFVTLPPDDQRTTAIHAPDWYTLLSFVAAQYGLEVDVEIQSAAAQRLLDLYERQLEALLKQEQREGQEVLRVYKPEIAQYKADVARWLEEGRQAATRDIPYLRQRHYQRWQELQRTAAPWLAAVDQMDASFRRDLAALATPEQRQARGDFRAPKTTLDWIDALTRYGLPAIGLCLMLGLLTRSAALAGAVFMLLVSLSQLALPGVVPAPHPSQGHAFLISKEVLEMLALLVLAATAAGRWFGLDYIIHHAVVRPLLGKRETDAPDA
jgi:uncharacterized membrane protein YphA (DoxX/SURF4 family)